MRAHKTHWTACISSHILARMLEHLTEFIPLLWIVVPVSHAIGIGATIHALLYVRTSQGTVAWVLFMITVPYLAVPLYFIFGRNRFLGYIHSRRHGDDSIINLAERVLHAPVQTPGKDCPDNRHCRAFERLAGLPFTGGNSCELLIDGTATFDAIFRAIDEAQTYIIIQFFIIKDDMLGHQLKDRLMARAKDGIRIYLLYDEIGSRKLRNEFKRDLVSAGVQVRDFNTTRGIKNKLQLNFRNHRKIVIADGQVGFVGGHNVGDEYLGLHPRHGHWRDTHVRVEGPAVAHIQLAFLDDWYWSSREIPEFNWNPTPPPSASDQVLVVPTGPADELATCSLFFVEAVHAARERFWLSSPYFVPDEEFICALQLAALRGVDVRILMPNKPDHLMVYLASFSYLDDLEMENVRFYRYEPGFLHQKAMLVDDLAVIGTANADSRSFRLNFEISLVFSDSDFTGEVAQMLESDFAKSRHVTLEDYSRRGIFFKSGVQIARLFAPIL